MISIHAPRGGSDFPKIRNDWQFVIFQSTLPVGGATIFCSWKSNTKTFQSTLPVGGATGKNRNAGKRPSISIHAPRGGSDLRIRNYAKGSAYFNPRSPWGERLGLWLDDMDSRDDISIHAPRGGSDDVNHDFIKSFTISIHAPRGGSDFDQDNTPVICSCISIHAPRGGSDFAALLSGNVSRISIHAPRGGSDEKPSVEPQPTVISIHAPRGGSDAAIEAVREEFGCISIHAPRGGSDRRSISKSISISGFQSTLPVGGATRLKLEYIAYDSISIHAPRGGSDRMRGMCRPKPPNFNPRSPWGERLASTNLSISSGVFQSTLPVGGATRSAIAPAEYFVISIHAPRGGSDHWLTSPRWTRA